MIRKREHPIAVKAGALALLMHGMFFLLLVVSFSWKQVQPPQAVLQVELWDSLPQPEAVTPPPVVQPEPPLPPVEPEIKPEPKPEPPPEPKAEIQVKKPPPEVKKPPKEEPKKPDPAIKKQEEEKKRLEEKKLELEKLKKAMLNDLPEQHDDSTDRKKLSDAKAAADARRAADTLAASSGVIDEYRAKIVAKIKRYVNKEACGTGKPELLFAIALIPGGDVSGSPRLLKSSGIAACDQAVERAILQAQPLPLPPQNELFSQFRELNLKFRPNESQ